ncbi:MAG: transglutaminase domain-containing protein [Planctomycetes bacterium]|nr:transglutaminase domain-containing protein [Planctomycetota bacterium]
MRYSVLPYASINEKRDNWRKDFFERFRPLIKNTKTPAEAAALLNRKIFPLLKVRYSTKRRKADQSPYESMETGTASCTGLSVLLIDACRAVGVPARFVGTPLWTNKSGNHSWVEVWDKGWHFTGAAEPTGNVLDRAWFAGRASTAIRGHRLHAIYAVSFKRTPLTFPLVWDRMNTSVFAVNVTNRYTRKTKKLPRGVVRVLFRVVHRSSSDRVAAAVRILDANDKLLFQGTSNDERFDANDHLTAELKQGRKYRLEIRFGKSVLKKTIEPKANDQLFKFRIGAD